MVLLRCIYLLKGAMSTFVVFSLSRKLKYIQKHSKTFYLQIHFWKCTPNDVFWFAYRDSWHSALVLARCIGRLTTVTSKLAVFSWSPKLIYTQQTRKSFHHLNFEISCRVPFCCEHFISLCSEAVPRHFINPHTKTVMTFVVFSWSPKLIYMHKTRKSFFQNLRFVISCRVFFFSEPRWFPVQHWFCSAAFICSERQCQALSFSPWVESWYTFENRVRLSTFKFIFENARRTMFSDSLIVTPGIQLWC